jgi:hypothetical protein
MASSTSAWTPRDVIRWGIIGCGDVTEVKSGPGFQKSTSSKLVAVMRRNAILAEDYARRHGVPKWYSDADALINDPEVDAVYIATPPGSHLEYALRVAAAGKPCHVETPIRKGHAVKIGKRFHNSRHDPFPPGGSKTRSVFRASSC